jgi:hypothetical protein
MAAFCCVTLVSFRHFLKEANNMSNKKNRYCESQVATVFESADIKMFETRGASTVGDIDEAIYAETEFLRGNVSVAESVWGSAYEVYAKYARYCGKEPLSREVFAAMAVEDATYRGEHMYQMGWGTPELIMKLNTPEGGRVYKSIRDADAAGRYLPVVTDGLVSKTRGTQIRLNIADCPSILMAESRNGETVAISAWHLGYAPVGYGQSALFLRYCAENESDKVVYLTPGIREIDIYGEVAAKFNPPDKEFWGFADRTADGKVVMRLAAYVRNLAERVGAHIVNAETEDTYDSPHRYSHRAAGNYGKLADDQNIGPSAKVNGRNGYQIAWKPLG